jgi:hypothetical protein
VTTAQSLRAKRKSCGVGQPELANGIISSWGYRPTIALLSKRPAMTHVTVLLALGFTLAAHAFSQPGGHMAVAGSPRVTLKGKIAKIQLAHGQGMPSLEVSANGATTRIMLGSFRYLLEQNFNPKAGDEVTVKGFKVNDSIIAVTVEHQGKVLKLRDEQGRPVWMRRRHGKS